MKTFALRNGDLVLAGSKYGMVEGIARVQQQVGLAMREPLGSDRFHREWGSVLDDWIGSVINEDITFEVRSEVIRVVRDFIIRQNEQVKSRASIGRRAIITAEEMITDISSLRVEQDQDALIVKVTLRTASNQEFTILTSPGSTV
jgi:phage baseplate assembly protein W